MSYINIKERISDIKVSKRLSMGEKFSGNKRIPIVSHRYKSILIKENYKHQHYENT